MGSRRLRAGGDPLVALALGLAMAVLLAAQPLAGAAPFLVLPTAEARLGFEDAPGALGGWAVSLSGGTALVGAPAALHGGTRAGAVYVFERSGSGALWSQAARLTSPDGPAFDLFGYAVALDGDTAVVGAPESDAAAPDSGAAYVFRRVAGAWVPEARLTAGDAITGERLGWSVAIQGDAVLVGAPLASDLGIGSGSAYVFRRADAGWVQEAKLLAGDGSNADVFGFAVALHGDTALVGAPGDAGPGPIAGSAYVFVRAGAGWVQEAKLKAPDAASVDWFGRSVALLGDTALIGVPFDDDGAPNAGSAHVFVREAAAWRHAVKLVPRDAVTSAAFGLSVAIGGRTYLVGAPFDDNRAGTDAGAVYAVSRENPSLPATKLLAFTAGRTATLGYAVALAESSLPGLGTALAGAPELTRQPKGPGAAFAFAGVGPPG